VFDSLTQRLQSIFATLRGRGALTEKDVDVALRDVRIALLEADVHFQVVKDFLVKVRAKATGQEVLKSLTPAQAVIRVVRDELVELLGGEAPARLNLAAKPPAVIFMVGLQGSGKTTTTAKLAVWLAAAKHYPLLISTDVYRPAAREQLRILAQQAGLAVHHPEDERSPLELLRLGLGEARSKGHDVLLVDTAGRLHVDDDLMEELRQLTTIAPPSEILFVADAMTGQDAVRSAGEFKRRIGTTGIVLTKLDGDARGGAALSATSVTGCPIKFVGVGEKLEDFEPFHPPRLASRILGMGDILSLIERAEQTVDREKSEELARKMLRSEFTLEDFREQLGQVRKLGPLDRVIGMLPGAGALRGMDAERGEQEIRRSLAILDSMTLVERRDASVINGSRRKRIARGSGTRVEDVNRLMKQYLQMRKMLKGLKGGPASLRRMATQLQHLR
jgi:signal recognition particle subunit SRP54